MPAAPQKDATSRLPASSPRATTTESRTAGCCESARSIRRARSEAANLDLMVDPPEILDIAVGPVAREIAGPIEPARSERFATKRSRVSASRLR